MSGTLQQAATNSWVSEREAIARAFSEGRSGAVDSARPSQNSGSAHLSQGLTRFDRFDEFRSTRKVEFVLQRLRQIGKRREGWDGECAVAPKARAILEATSFLARLSNDISFEAEAEPDGAITLTTEGNGIRLILTFEGDDLVSVAKRCNAQWDDCGSFAVTVPVLRIDRDVEKLLNETV